MKDDHPSNLFLKSLRGLSACILSFMLWSHFQVKAHPVWATQDNFSKIEWDIAISWLLQGLCSCYGIYVDVMGSTSHSYTVALSGQIYVRGYVRRC